jgi:cytochrome c
MNTPARIVVIAALIAPTVFAQEPETLMDEARCGTCHKIDQPMLGPSYQAIAERYRDQDGAAGKIFSRMREGSKGIWGQAPMPPVTEGALSDEELNTVVDWILSR